MPEILVVEGLTDAKFFQELFRRLYLKDSSLKFDQLPGRRNMPKGIQGITSQGREVSLEFRYRRRDSEEVSGGVSAIPEITRELLATNVGGFTVAKDMDRSDPRQVFQSIQDLVSSHAGTEDITFNEAEGRISFSDGLVNVVPMGIGQNPRFAALGIASHSMEDYLIELMLEDSSLRQNVPTLNALLLEILPSIRNADGSFDSSKELFQLIKPIVQHGFSDTGVVQKLVRDADQNILRSVLAPLLADMEPAFDV